MDSIPSTLATMASIDDFVRAKDEAAYTDLFQLLQSHKSEMATIQANTMAVSVLAEGVSAFKQARKTLECCQQAEVDAVAQHKAAFQAGEGRLQREKAWRQTAKAGDVRPAEDYVCPWGILEAIAAASYALNQAKAAVPPAAAAVEEAVTETLSRLAAVKPVDAPAAAAPPTTPDPVLAQRAADADAEIAQLRDQLALSWDMSCMLGAQLADHTSRATLMGMAAAAQQSVSAAADAHHSGSGSGSSGGLAVKAASAITPEAVAQPGHGSAVLHRPLSIMVKCIESFSQHMTPAEREQLAAAQQVLAAVVPAAAFNASSDSSVSVLGDGSVSLQLRVPSGDSSTDQQLAVACTAASVLMSRLQSRLAGSSTSMGFTFAVQGTQLDFAAAEAAAAAEGEALTAAVSAQLAAAVVAAACGASVACIPRAQQYTFGNMCWAAGEDCGAAMVPALDLGSEQAEVDGNSGSGGGNSSAAGFGSCICAEDAAELAAAVAEMEAQEQQQDAAAVVTVRSGGKAVSARAPAALLVDVFAGDDLDSSEAGDSVALLVPDEDDGGSMQSSFLGLRAQPQHSSGDEGGDSSAISSRRSSVDSLGSGAGFDTASLLSASAAGSGGLQQAPAMAVSQGSGALRVSQLQAAAALSAAAVKQAAVEQATPDILSWCGDYVVVDMSQAGGCGCDCEPAACDGSDSSSGSWASTLWGWLAGSAEASQAADTSACWLGCSSW